MKIKELEPIVQKVLDDYPNHVQAYKNGQVGLIGMFAGEVMKQSKGKADPKDIIVILKEKLK